MNRSWFGITIPFSKNVALSRIVLFSSLLFSLHTFASPSPFIVLLPLSAPLWLDVLSTTLLWIVVFLSQKCSPPLCPYELYVIPQTIAPQLRLPPIFQCTVDLLM